jgi:hypothetical protein
MPGSMDNSIINTRCPGLGLICHQLFIVKTTIMKKSMLLAAICAILINSSLLYAQQKSPVINKAYLDLGTGSAPNNGAASEIGVHLAFQNNWIAALSHHSITAEPNNLPSDYDPGYITFFFLPFSNSTPTIKISFTSITAGKILPTGRKTWLTAEAGISIVHGDKAKFTRAPVDVTAPYLFFGIGGTSSNYNMTVDKKTTVGPMFRTDFNWAFCQVAGLGIGGYADPNSIQSAAGIEMRVTIGWMNYKKKQKHQPAGMRKF